MAKGETRKKKIEATLLRALLKHNVEILAARRLPGNNLPQEIFEASKKASLVNPVSRQNAQRIFTLEFGGSLDQLQALADGLGVKPHELLDPDLESYYVREAAKDARREVGEKEKSKPTTRARRTRRNAPPAVP